MKKGWVTKELSAVSAINYGYTESASSEPVGPRFLRITDIQDDHVDWDRVPYCKIERADLPKYRLATGDIVFARTGATTGKSFLVDEPPEAVFASYLIRLRLLDKRLLPEFVLLFFQTAGYWQSIKDGSSGSAQGGFNATKLGGLIIPLPPLPEQHRIVGLLDEAFEGLATAKANAEKNLQNARALFESHLQSVFTQRGPGWVEKNLGDLCQIKTGKKDVNEGNPDGRYPFFTCAAAHTFSEHYSFDTEALLVAGNGNVGQVSYYSGKFEAYQRTYVLFDFKGVTAKYLFRVLDKRLSATLSKQKLGNTMPYIKIGMLTDFVVPVPPPKEQELVAESLGAIAEETQRLARLYDRKLDALEALQKSLLHQAFTGEL